MNLHRAKTGGCEIADSDLKRLHPYLTGAVTGYAVGMFSLTLNYIVPTYMILGLAAAWNRVATTRPPTPPAPFDLRLVRRFLALSLFFLVVLTLFVRVFFKH